MKERKERESLRTVTHYVLKNNTNTLVNKGTDFLFIKKY